MKFQINELFRSGDNERDRRGHRLFALNIQISEVVEKKFESEIISEMVFLLSYI